MSRPRLCVLVCGLLLVLLAWSVAGVRGVPLHAQPGPPNIVLILADDLGYGDLSSYGAPDMQTPHIDALGADGVRFTQFYANSPVCSPTRASIMTGRYPSRVGVPGVIRMHDEDSWGYLDPDAVLLPRLLQEAGYHTAHIGKWHLGFDPPNTPLDRGFAHFRGFMEGMMDDYYDHLRFGENFMRDGRDVVDPEGHATDIFTDWAVAYVASRAGMEAPFFLYLAYNAPHTPIQPREDWLERVRRREPGLTEKRAKLVALIEHMDDGVGRVLQAVDEAGVAENTLVLFVSDNGGQVDVGANNGGLRDGKQSMYEGGLRVPLLARWPGHIPAGITSEQIAVTMDLFPTLLHVAGTRASHAIEGENVWPAFLGEPARPLERDLYFERREGNLRYNGLTIQALRRGDWKLLQNSPYAPFELYNLADDPHETHNLIEEHRDVYEALAKSLREHIRRGGAVPWTAPEE